MPKCKGHVHVSEKKMELCGSELRNVGFIRMEDGKIEERYVCTNKKCSRYEDNHCLPTSTIKEGN